jgi:hypothetical protein
MITMQQSTKAGTNGAPGALNVKVRDVTGVNSAELRLDPSLRVSAVAEAVANRLALPSDTTWALRSEQTAAFLDNDKSLADALGPGEHTEVALVATPKAHLG